MPLFRKRQRAQSAEAFVMLEGELRVNVAGESHYQDALEKVCGPKSAEGVDENFVATLVLDPENPYDPNAVAVYINGHKVGHLPRDAAQAYQPLGQRLARQGKEARCAANVAGGWDRGRADSGHFGVTLLLPRPA